MNCRVVVIGGNHHNTLGVVRALGQKEVFPFVVIVSRKKTSFVLKSRYIDGGLIIPTVEEAVSFVKVKFSGAGSTIIYSCADEVTCTLDKHYDELKDNYIFFNGMVQGKISRLTNKYEMQHLALMCGLNIPTTVRIEGAAIPQGISYPCITKDMDNVNGSKRDMKLFLNEEQLANFLKHQNKSTEILVQHYIDKELEFQLIGCSVINASGEYDIIIPGHTEILRAQPVTNTGFLEYLSNEGFEYDVESCHRFIQACRYTGLFSIEFIRGKDGKDYFLEINFRNDGNAYVVTKAGVNLPYIYYLNAIGENYTTEAKQPIIKQISMPVVKDFKTVLQGRVSVFQWLKDLKRTNCFLYKDKKDPAPLRAYIKELLTNRI